MILCISRESFFVFPTSSKLYALCGGLGADLGGGVVNGVTLALDGWFGAGDTG